MLRKFCTDILRRGFSIKKQSNYHFNYEDVHEKTEEEFQLEVPKGRGKHNLSFKFNEIVPENAKTLNIQNMSLRHLKDTD